MTDIDDRIRQKITRTVNALHSVEAISGISMARETAATTATAARDYIASRFGRREAFQLMQELADGCLTPDLPQDKPKGA